MAVTSLESAPVDVQTNDGHRAGRLDGALEVVTRAAGADCCAVAWIDAWSSVGSSGFGPESAPLEDSVRRLMAADRGEGPVVPDDLAWVFRLTARNGEHFGCLALDQAPDPDSLELVEVAARHVACLLETSRFEAGQTAAYRALVEVCSQIQAEELRTDEILALIVRGARRLMEVDVTWLALLDEDADRVIVKVASGARTETFVRMWVQVGVGVGGLAIQDRRPVVVRDHRTFENPTTDLVKHAIDSEGIISMICVPMVFEGEVVGALYGGSRTPTDFTELAVSVFAALASQAAAAIVHSRLYRTLADNNATLTQALTLHQSLSEAALSGEGIHGIAAELARVIERDVIVRREGGTGRESRYSSDGSVASSATPPRNGGAAAEPPGPEVDDDDLAVPITAGSELLGTINVAGEAAVTDLQRTALRQAATVMALEIMRERASLEAEWRLRGELLEEILSAEGERPEGLSLRAEQAGIDLAEPRCLALIEPTEPCEPRDLQILLRVSLNRYLDSGDALVAMRGERALVAFALGQAEAADVVRGALAKGMKAGVPAIAGLSEPRTNLAIALKESEATLRLAAEGGPGGLVMHDFGPLRFLLDGPGTDEMVAMVVDLLGPIARSDNNRAGGGIMETLRAHLELGSRPAVAERCHIHVSTVKYRMQKARDLLGRSISEPRVRFQLMLAFEVLDVLRTLGIDPLRDLGRDEEKAAAPGVEAARAGQ
ncbi:MAG: GAF domain-containing protein [Actinobacteria bacterium]|nr:GAF domain-containing protein [Actinomycetota bacterium]